MNGDLLAEVLDLLDSSAPRHDVENVVLAAMEGDEAAPNRADSARNLSWRGRPASR